MLSKDYNFYFDETHHDKAIKLSDSKLNMLADNILDDYIGFFWGLARIKYQIYWSCFRSLKQNKRKSFPCLQRKN